MYKNKSRIKKLQELNVAILPTMVGACTLANVYESFGYGLIKHIVMLFAVMILIAYLIKIINHYDVFRSEYSDTVSASLHAGFTMIVMILGSYYFNFNQTIGRWMWFIGLVMHFTHIVIFTYRHVIKGINKETFVPSWFVTYNGVLVSTVVGKPMGIPILGKAIVYYGIFMFTLIVPFMVYRLIKHNLHELLTHTKAIILSPSSLCLVSYFNFIDKPNEIIVLLLYMSTLISLIFIIIMIPKFFSFKFTPGFAGLTFPMAIGLVSSMRMADYLKGIGQVVSGNICNQIAGIQLILTTTIISFVIYNFAIRFANLYKTE